jgi:hypothetical protein
MDPALSTIVFTIAMAVHGAGQELPAFPGAQGFGALTPGGRGGRIVEVTNLKDSGPGSLREACYASGPRIILFRVAGIIELQTDIKISHGFVTIAGQTAPGDGICLKGATLRICTHDVVVRFMRCRVGDGQVGATPGNRDALKIEGARVRNVVVDHCSLSWSIDENVSTWGTPRDVTIQWCIIAEALYQSRHPKGPHSMGLLVGDRSTRMTFHHNLLAHNHWRNPLMQGRGDPLAEYDFRNNVIYNYGKFCSVARGRIHLNYEANFIKPGPTSVDPNEIDIDLDRKTNAWPRIFLSGNIGPNCSDGPGDNWRMVRDMAKLGQSKLRVTQRFPFPAVTTKAATDAYKAVLKHAGATQPRRDAVDARIVRDVEAGTGKVVNSQDAVGGWPQYESGPLAADSDHDGMPDRWERQHGLDPRDTNDGAKDRDGDGYTNVEEYLNGTTP